MSSLTVSEVEAELRARGFYPLSASAPETPQESVQASTDIITAVTSGKSVSVWLFILIGLVSLALMENTNGNKAEGEGD